MIMFGRIGPFELILILAVVLIIFGPKKLPEIGSAVGKAFQNLRDGFKKKDVEAKGDAGTSVTEAKNPEPPQAPADKA
jgi:sec-independent protein translocase protein TatA